MKFMSRYLALTMTGLALGVCATNSLAQATDAAETACMVAVNNNYGGNVKELNVVSSEFSEAGSLVMLDADGERWRCLASNDGQVEDLSVEEAAGGGAQDNLEDLVGMHARDLDSELANRGFNNTGGYKTDSSSFTTWWNADSRQCVSVEVSDGRVANIESIVEGNCL